ncbi:MAG: rhodanese-like domain-containing protein [Pseudomonadota bacterium]|nr:rhodanese-like domain-containing protein [Pseudomonadota bacterium]
MRKIGGLSMLIALATFLFGPASLWGQQQAVTEIAPEQLRRLLDEKAEVVLINTMSAIECRDHAIPGSLCLPCETFQERLDLLPADKGKKLIYYCESDLCLRSYKSANKAREMGYRDVSVLKGGLPGWKQAGYTTAAQERIPRKAIPSIKASRLKKWLEEGEPIFLLDIRSEDAFRQGGIKGAVNIPFYRLDRLYQDLPLDRRIVLVDERGFRSFLASCYLARKGYDTTRLFGGMESWRKALKGTNRLPAGQGK